MIVDSNISRPLRLLDQFRTVLRCKHYSSRTEEAYEYWIRFFIRWHARSGVTRHPRDMGALEVQAFLAMLVTERGASVSTHNQALSALLFLYREVLGLALPWLQDLKRPTRPKRTPSVLALSEVAALLAALEGEMALLAKLLYGTGMRLTEGLSLRVKDVEFERNVILVHGGKGGKDRIVMLPRSLVAPLRAQRAAARIQWERDRERGFAPVAVPEAMAASDPDLGRRWAWFWLFPAATTSFDARRDERRHHIYEERLQRAVKLACAAAGISKPVSVHTLRHYSAFRNIPCSAGGARAAGRTEGDGQRGVSAYSTASQGLEKGKQLVVGPKAPGNELSGRATGSPRLVLGPSLKRSARQAQERSRDDRRS